MNNKIKVTNIETQEEKIYTSFRKIVIQFNINYYTIYKYSQSGETYKDYKYKILNE